MRQLAVLVLLLGVATAAVDQALFYKCCVAKQFGDNAPCKSICTGKEAKVDEFKAATSKEFDPAKFAKSHAHEVHVQDKDGDGVDDWRQHSSDALLVSNDHGKKSKASKAFLEVVAKTTTKTRNPYADGKQWPKGEIFYQWDSSVDDSATGDGKTAHDLYLAAIAAWEKDTCLQFVHKTSGSVKLVGTNSGSGAPVGTGAIGQECEVDMTESLDAFAHELGHVICLDHTNERSDADPTWIHLDVDACAADLLDENNGYVTCYIDSGTGAVADDFPSWVTYRDTECDRDETYVVDTYLKDKYQIPGTTYDKTDAAQKLNCTQAVCVKQWLGQYGYPAPTTPAKFAGPYDCSNVMHYPRPTTCLEDKGCKDKPAPGTHAGTITAADRDAINEIYGCDCHDVVLPFDTPVTKKLCHHPNWTVADFKKYSAKQGGSPDPDPFADASFEVHVGTTKKTGTVSSWSLGATDTVTIKKV